MKLSVLLLGLALTLGLAFAQDTGGATGGSTGGGMTGGDSTGGSMSGGMSDATGGSSTGGASTGGSATGGASTGGSETGGASTGGSTSLSEESGSIADIVAGDPQFSTLLQALSAAGLAEELSSGGPYTVLAPTNDAFSALSSDELDSLLSNPQELADILQNHVISGEYDSSQLAGFPAALTLTGEELSIQSDGSGGFTIGGASVESADVQATNGLIHVIDTVILPSSMDSQTGGSSTGGSATGGASTGGSETGGSMSGSTGGSSTGGSATGGSSTGGSATGGQ